MYKLGLLIFFLSIFQTGVKAQNIYNLSVFLLKEDSLVELSRFQGKKILIVNTATGGSNASQILQMQQLYNMLKDSGLVVIACPSNSFGNEPVDSVELEEKYMNDFNLSFPITNKIIVNGPDRHPLYNWLRLKSLNGEFNCIIRSDFTKVLIDSNGKLVGFFDDTINPLDEVLINTIRAIQ